MVCFQFLTEIVQFYAFMVVMFWPTELDRALVEQVEQVFVDDFVAFLADRGLAIHTPGCELFRVMAAIKIR